MSTNKKAATGIWPGIFLAIMSTSLTLLALEVLARAYDRNFRLVSARSFSVNLLQSAYPASFHPQLGHVPRSGFSSSDNQWGTLVTIVEDGIRSNGPNPAHSWPDNGLIIAVGDSFTFGDQVSDSETWPADLERLLGMTVLNGGVFGYGVDQSYLRAIQLIEKYKPSVVIFSFIADDINRTQLSERTGVPKPYFVYNGGNVELHTSHIRVPEGTNISNTVKNVFGYSHLIHRLMTKLAPAFWMSRTWVSAQVHEDGVKVSCVLLNRLAQL